MGKKVVILGGSGVGMIAASILARQHNVQVVGFLNDSLPVGSEIGKYQKVRVIGRSEEVGRFLDDSEVFFFVAYFGYLHEKRTYEKVKALGIPRDRLLSIVDETAVVPHGFCSVGEGVLLAPLSQLSADTTVSDNCVVLPNSFLGHDSFLDEFAHLATNAVVGATVHVGKAVHVGSNATIVEEVRLGDFSFVGAGAVVTRDVPERAVVVGNPARVLRYKEEE